MSLSIPQPSRTSVESGRPAGCRTDDVPGADGKVAIAADSSKQMSSGIGAEEALLEVFGYVLPHWRAT